MARARRKAKGSNRGNSVANALKREERKREHDASLYRPEMCAAVIDCGKHGMTETEMAVYVCRVSRKAMRNWAEKHPEFQAALDEARDHAKAWWESTGRIRLRTPNFNTHLYNKIISCRFREDYSERMTIEGDADRPLVHKIERVIVKAPKAARPA